MATKRRVKTTPISIRLTEEEKNRLTLEAGHLSLSDFVRFKLFGTEQSLRRDPVPQTNARALAHVLAALGQSELAPTLREMMMAARVGALPVTDETERAIQMACAATVQMKANLLSALGAREGRSP
jgi:hypothetical protein